MPTVERWLADINPVTSDVDAFTEEFAGVRREGRVRIRRTM
jgi:hypothetical protein